MKDCVLFSKLSDTTLQCFACSRRCVIKDGATGVCGVRKNYKGYLKLLVWDKPTGVAIDPIEKKPLFHFLPGSPVFSFGTFGCNFGCLFCQNATTSQLSKTAFWKTKYSQFLEQLESWPAKKIVSYCKENNIPSIAFTYNEPSIFAEYAVDVMKLARKNGIKGIFVTNGYQTKECLDFIEPYIDAYNIDLKSFRSDFYQAICKASLSPVLETIKRIHDMGKWLEITTLIIDKENDTDKELSDIAQFITQLSPDIPWHLSACHPDYKMTDIRITPKNTLARAVEIGKKAGLQYIYVGNIHNFNSENTFCPSCKAILIARNNYDITKNSMKKDICPNCRTHIPGVWQ